MQVSTEQLRGAVKRCPGPGPGHFTSCNHTSCISSMQRSELMKALDFCIFEINNMTAEERKEFIADSLGSEHVSSSELDFYSIYYSQHGSLLHTAAAKGNKRMLRILLDHSPFSILEAVHTSSRETALVAAVRLCNIEVCVIQR